MSQRHFRGFEDAWVHDSTRLLQCCRMCESKFRLVRVSRTVPQGIQTEVVITESLGHPHTVYIVIIGRGGGVAQA